MSSDPQSLNAQSAIGVFELTYAETSVHAIWVISDGRPWGEAKREAIRVLSNHFWELAKRLDLSEGESDRQDYERFSIWVRRERSGGVILLTNAGETGWFETLPKLLESGLALRDKAALSNQGLEGRTRFDVVAMPSLIEVSASMVEPPPLPKAPTGGSQSRTGETRMGETRMGETRMGETRQSSSRSTQARTTGGEPKAPTVFHDVPLGVVGMNLSGATVKALNAACLKVFGPIAKKILNRTLEELEFIPGQALSVGQVNNLMDSLVAKAERADREGFEQRLDDILMGETYE